MFPQNQSSPNMEKVSAPNTQQFNVAPGLGNVAANLSPSDPNTLNMAPTTPETAPVQSQEKLSNPEVQVGPGQSGASQAPIATASVQQPVLIPTVTPIGNTTVNAAPPAIAADEDLIEKEWVSQAKSIVARTKDDPYEQARLVAELMRDYVKKRYGRDVGKAQDYN